jgi:Enoyl-CoA hydratase/isomerase
VATILSTREQAIATVTIDRPDKLNALDYATIDQLLVTLDQLEADPDVPAVILTGAGRAFSAGADIPALAASIGGGVDQALREVVHRHDRGDADGDPSTDSADRSRRTRSPTAASGSRSAGRSREEGGPATLTGPAVRRRPRARRVAGRGGACRPRPARGWPVVAGRTRPALQGRSRRAGRTGGGARRRGRAGTSPGWRAP